MYRKKCFFLYTVEINDSALLLEGKVESKLEK